MSLVSNMTQHYTLIYSTHYYKITLMGLIYIYFRIHENWERGSIGWIMHGRGGQVGAQKITYSPGYSCNWLLLKHDSSWYIVIVSKCHHGKPPESPQESWITCISTVASLHSVYFFQCTTAGHSLCLPTTCFLFPFDCQNKWREIKWDTPFW